MRFELRAGTHSRGHLRRFPHRIPGSVYLDTHLVTELGKIIYPLIEDISHYVQVQPLVLMHGNVSKTDHADESRCQLSLNEAFSAQKDECIGTALGDAETLLGHEVHCHSMVAWQARSRLRSKASK